MNYNNQFYMQELQGMKDRIDSQMRQMQQNQMQQQQPIPQPITQNFQIAPTQNNNELEGRYAKDINDVKNTFVVKTGIFVNKDFTEMWIKDTTGNVRTFRTEEIVELDPKDREINDLKKQLAELKGMVLNATKYDNANDDGETSSTKPSTISKTKSTNAK